MLRNSRWSEALEEFWEKAGGWSFFFRSLIFAFRTRGRNDLDKIEAFLCSTKETTLFHYQLFATTSVGARNSSERNWPEEILALECSVITKVARLRKLAAFIEDRYGVPETILAIKRRLNRYEGERRARVLFVLGLLLFRAGERGEAIACWEECVQAAGANRELASAATLEMKEAFSRPIPGPLPRRYPVYTFRAAWSGVERSSPPPKDIPRAGAWRRLMSGLSEGFRPFVFLFRAMCFRFWTRWRIDPDKFEQFFLSFRKPESICLVLFALPYGRGKGQLHAERVAEALAVASSVAPHVDILYQAADFVPSLDYSSEITAALERRTAECDGIRRGRVLFLLGLLLLSNGDINAAVKRWKECLEFAWEDKDLRVAAAWQLRHWD